MLKLDSPRVKPLAILLAAICVVALSAPARAAELEDVLARFDRVQDSIQTLSAQFTETTSNQLLKDPIVAEGLLYMTKPAAIRWEYRTPEEMRFVIADDVYTGYFPAQNRAEKRNIRRYSEQLFRFLGLGQGSAELRKFYDIRLEPSADEDGPLLVLEPKKRRARKRVAEVRLQLDPQSYLPVSVEYRSKDGGSRSIEFTDVLINPDLAAGLYEMNLPAGVKMSSGFSGLPEFNAEVAP